MMIPRPALAPEGQPAAASSATPPAPVLGDVKPPPAAAPAPGTQTTAAPAPAKEAPASPLGDVKPPEPAADAAKAEADKKAAEEKAAADAKAKANEKVTFKPPEGSPIKPEDIEGWSGIFKDAGMNSEQAQKLVDAWHKATSSPEAKKLIEAAQAQAAQEVRQKQFDTDLAASRALPKLGGANFMATVEIARGVLSKFPGGAGVSKVLKAAGLDANPEMLTFLHSIHSAMQDDKTSQRVTNDNKPTTTATPLSRTERQAAVYAKK